MRLLLIFGVVLSACIPPSALSTLELGRVTGETGKRQLQYCVIRSRWTVDELTSSCGDPDEWTLWTGVRDGRCAIYRNDARAFVTGAGSSVSAVCFKPTTAKNRTLRIEKVIGLDGSILQPKT